MPYENFEPGLRLKSHVKCIWYVERLFTADADSFEITPDSYVELVFCMPSTPIHYLQKDITFVMPNTFVVGLLTSPFSIKTSGMLKAIGIRFYPWGFYDLFAFKKGIPRDLMSHPVIRAMESFITEKMEGSHRVECITGIQGILSDALSDSTQEDKVRKASETLDHERGLIKIDELAARHFVSARQLGRIFNDKLGVSPKLLASLIRFEHIRDRIYEDPAINLTQLAYEFDYADQSHFIADFKKFSGRSPRAFARNMKALKETLSEYNVRFSQS